LRSGERHVQISHIFVDPPVAAMVENFISLAQSHGEFARPSHSIKRPDSGDRNAA